MLAAEQRREDEGASLSLPFSPPYPPFPPTCGKNRPSFLILKAKNPRSIVHENLILNIGGFLESIPIYPEIQVNPVPDLFFAKDPDGKGRRGRESFGGQGRKMREGKTGGGRERKKGVGRSWAHGRRKGREEIENGGGK